MCYYLKWQKANVIYMPYHCLALSIDQFMLPYFQSICCFTGDILLDARLHGKQSAVGYLFISLP